MSGLPIIIYAVVSYWAASKTVYSKSLPARNMGEIGSRCAIAMIFGWILIPFMVIKLVLSKRESVVRQKEYDQRSSSASVTPETPSAPDKIDEVPTSSTCADPCDTTTPEAPSAPDKIGKAPNSPTCAEPCDAPRLFSFEKTKGFSYLDYKCITTTAELYENRLTIDSKTAWFGIIKGSEKEATIRVEEITAVSSRRTWDFWDLAFAVLFLVVGLMGHWLWLLLALLFVYTAAGHAIGITLKNGLTETIPCGSLDPTDEFISILKNQLKHNQ